MKAQCIGMQGTFDVTGAQRLLVGYTDAVALDGIGGDGAGSRTFVAGNAPLLRAVWRLVPAWWSVYLSEVRAG